MSKKKKISKKRNVRPLSKKNRPKNHSFEVKFGARFDKLKEVSTGMRGMVIQLPEDIVTFTTEGKELKEQTEKIIELISGVDTAYADKELSEAEKLDKLDAAELEVVQIQMEAVKNLQAIHEIISKKYAMLKEKEARKVESDTDEDKLLETEPGDDVRVMIAEELPSEHKGCSGKDCSCDGKCTVCTCAS